MFSEFKKHTLTFMQSTRTHTQRPLLKVNENKQNETTSQRLNQGGIDQIKCASP